MYKVLIADDEDIIRCGLARFVERDPDFHVVAMAEDGQMALELAKEQRPDLALVDINMPFLNGINLTSQLRAVDPDIIIVIISGYDDFQYAQDALRLGVMDYLLKPIMEDSFFDLLARVKKKLSEKQHSKKYLDWAKDQLERCKPSLVERFFLKWTSRQLDELEVYDQLQYLGLELPAQHEISAINLKDNIDQNGDPTEADWDENLLYFACQNIVQELYMEEGASTICFHSQQGNLIVLSGSIPPDRWQILQERIVSTVEQILPVKVILAHAAGAGILAVPDTIDTAVAQMQSKLHYSNVVTQVLHYVDRNLSNCELTLQSVANALFVSPQHLSRLFKHETGDTFGAYLAQMRIRKAMVLLRNPKLKMYEVSSRCGYSSQYYFSSAFKKALGISPNEYRKNILGYGGEKLEKEK